MTREQNLYVLNQVRRDLALIGADVYVPEGMTHEEKLETFGEALKKREARRIIQFPTYARADMTPKQRKAVEEAIAARGEEATVFYPPPPSTQLFTQSYSAALDWNAVSPARNGPCMLDHVHILVFLSITGLSAPIQLGLHISTSPNVGPFAGEIPVFAYYDPTAGFGMTEGGRLNIYKQRSDTLVGWRNFEQYHFYPRMPIPYSTFYINASMSRTNYPSNCLVTCDFGSIEVPRGRVMGIAAIEPRIGRAPAVPKEAPPEPVVKTVMFASWYQMREYQALTNKIDWLTVRNTGRRDYPISALVVEKVPMYLPPNTT